MAGDFFEFRESIKGAGRKRAVVAPAPAGEGPLTVSQITAMVDGALKEGLPGRVAVRGEASGVKLHQASGHLYFSLKDAGACIDCIVYRRDAQRLRVMPEDGIELVATGQVRVYAPRGSYQLVCETVEAVGRGAFELAFRRTMERLKAAGLLEPERKRELPRYPIGIAMVTSRATAALRDMLKVLRRHGQLRLFLYHVPVQGEGAAAGIAAAVRHLSARGRGLGIELILLGRGGGSPEDLWAFNDEDLARAIGASAIPIVTGIGHEIDTSIADLVADHHAHTPTEAAQVAVAQWRGAGETIELHGTRLRRGARQLVAEARRQVEAIEREEIFRWPMRRIDRLRQLLDERQRGLELAASRRLGMARREADEANQRLMARHPRGRMAALAEKLAGMQAGLARRHPALMLGLYRQRLDEAGRRLAAAAAGAVRMRAGAVDAAAARLRGVSPEAVLRRGYSITTRKRDGRTVRGVADARVGDRLLTRLVDGSVESVVEDARQGRLFE